MPLLVQAYGLGRAPVHAALAGFQIIVNAMVVGLA